MPTNAGMTGVETFILQLAAAQQRAGCAPEIALTLSGRAAVPREASALGVTVHSMPETTVGGATSLWQKVQHRVRTLARLVSLSRNVDVLHIHACGIAGLEAFLASLLRRRLVVIVTHHATLSWFQSMRTRASDMTLWLEIRRADHAVMPYAAALEELRANGFPTSRSSVIPFCVDDGMFRPPSQPRRHRPGELRLAVVSRLHEGKGHAELLQAIARLAPRFPGLHATFFGEGALRPALETLTDTLGVRAHVSFAGQVTHDELPVRLHDAHVVVLPSYMPGETFPLSLLEGMATGMPAIGTRWFGIPDIVEDEVTGWLVEPCNADALLTVIQRLLLDPALVARAGALARARVEARFSASSVAESYLRLYVER